MEEVGEDDDDLVERPDLDSQDDDDDPFFDENDNDVPLNEQPRSISSSRPACESSPMHKDHHWQKFILDSLRSVHMEDQAVL